MTPSRVAVALRQIASKIEASKNPSRAAVSRDVRRVLAAMDSQNVVLEILGEDEDAVMASLGAEA